MKRLESNLLNMALSLTIISVVAATLLAVIFTLTEEPIAQAQVAKQQAAIYAVLPAVEGLEISEPETPADGIAIHRAYAAGEFVGAAVEAESNGFSGAIRLMVGFDKNGNIVNYEVLQQTETPGLGTKVVDWFKTTKNKQSILGLNPAEANLTVSKDGGDVDAITAATISSRAFLEAVQKAYNAYNNPAEADAWSSATTVVADTTAVDAASAATPVQCDSVATEAISDTLQIVESHE